MRAARDAGAGAATSSRSRSLRSSRWLCFIAAEATAALRAGRAKSGERCRSPGARPDCRGPLPAQTIVIAMGNTEEMARAAALPQADASSLVDAGELEAKVKEM